MFCIRSFLFRLYANSGKDPVSYRKIQVAMGKAQFDALPAELQQVVMDGAAAAQAAEHQLFLDNEEKYYNELQEKGMEYVEVDTQEFADAMIGGVLPTLTDSQKKLYDKIAALA